MQHFDLPEENAPVSEWKQFVEALNAVPLTMDQIERGYDVYTASALEEREDGLIRFAREEGLSPANVAATAIIMRAYVFTDALADGYDMKAENPQGYATIATDPFTLYRVYGDYQVVAGKWQVDPDDTDIVAL
ncbi:hypothetical protein FA702_04400 [Novosphingobium sp. EMRT-2]|nr:hypothetical protein FA702_04400 [Novosphingobium sp. EMRT-2]